MGKSSKRNKHISKTRVVFYSFCNYPNEFCADNDFDFDVEKRLAKAKKDGIITNYDDGRNRCPWFEGPPGKDIRALRDEFTKADKKRRAK